MHTEPAMQMAFNQIHMWTYIYIQRARFYKSFPLPYGANLRGSYLPLRGVSLWGYKS